MSQEGITLGEISHSQSDRYQEIPFNEAPKGVRFIGTESRVLVTRDCVEGRAGEVVRKGEGLEWEARGGLTDGITQHQLYLMKKMTSGDEAQGQSTGFQT